MIFNLSGIEQDEYTYNCNGVNDNIIISNIVKEFLSAGNDTRSLRLSVTGEIGLSGNARGSGTSSNPYGVFDFNVNSNRRVYIDFSNCKPIEPVISNGTYNIIFYTEHNMGIIGANISANNTATGTTIRVFNSSVGAIYAENCRFWINGYVNSLISMVGTFYNCRGSISNITENSYCFLPSTYGLMKIYGGEYYAYTGASNKQSAILAQSGSESVSILYGVSAPTLARAGFYQTNSILQWTGGGVLNCTDLVSALPLIVVTGISNIRGTITKSKSGVM